MLLQDAFERAQAFLDSEIRPEHEPEIVIARCDEDEDSWIFGYNTRAFLEDGDIMSGLAGNGPVVVPKSGEPAHIGPVFRER